MLDKRRLTAYIPNNLSAIQIRSAQDARHEKRLRSIKAKGNGIGPSREGSGGAASRGTPPLGRERGGRFFQNQLWHGHESTAHSDSADCRRRVRRSSANRPGRGLGRNRQALALKPTYWA